MRLLLLLLLLAALNLPAQLPRCSATLAQRQDFIVCFDTANRRPLWTAHAVKPSTTPGSRKHWRKDHELNSLPSSAFTNSGYHRGHLTPAADTPDSADTFLTSNAVAQVPQLNMGAWRALENRIRKHGQPGLVITGAIYGDCGNEQIEAPCYLYKIVRFADGATIAALLPNAPVALELTTIGEVERRAGISTQSESSAETASHP